MSDKIATQRTIQWIEAQRDELKAKIEQLTNELEQTRKEYNGFTTLLNLIQADENPSFLDTQEDYPDSAPSNISEIETNDSSNYEDENSDETSSEDISESVDDEDEIDDSQDREGHNSSPKDWLHIEYQSLPMEDVILEILKQYQPATPSDVARRIYKIAEDDPNFERARNSANAALTYGKRIGKWTTLRRGVYVLHSFQKSFAVSVNQNGHH
ncbi:MAG: hypothetical protein ACKPH7_18655 [Planktothrix sp.]|uniref:hypothetical protein n=1 Tax=Planktothrix sp. TaxID=3088171 RepID=UPI0038D39BDB